MTEPGTFVTDGHLGGYVAGGDPACIYPHLWRWLVHGPEGVRQILDVGCGDGAAIDWFTDLGAQPFGVDGVEQNHPRITQHDFTTEPWRLAGEIDLVWSCEFVEHVEAAYLDNFLPALCAGRLLLMTHAEPGQAGWHHVNCQPAEYWINAIEACGTHRCDSLLTQQTRALAAENLHPYNHYVRSGLAFRRIA